MAEAFDTEHLRFATNNDCILVSQDEDFLAINAQWQQLSMHTACWYLKVAPDLHGTAQISYVVRQLLSATEWAGVFRQIPLWSCHNRAHRRTARPCKPCGAGVPLAESRGARAGGSTPR